MTPSSTSPVRHENAVWQLIQNIWSHPSVLKMRTWHLGHGLVLRFSSVIVATSLGSHTCAGGDGDASFGSKSGEDASGTADVGNTADTADSGRTADAADVGNTA